MKDAGSTKNEIMKALYDSGIEWDNLDKVMKESGVKFRRKSGNTWKDIMADELIEDPTIDYDSMIKKLEDSVKDPEYYVKGYLDLFRKLVTS